EVSFFDDLGRISFKVEIQPGKISLIKAAVERILEAMPKNIIEDFRLHLLRGEIAFKVIYENSLVQSRLVKDSAGICLCVGRDVLPKRSDNLDMVLLWDLLSEGICSLMLNDYDELKKASRINENAYFKIELINNERRGQAL
ncbi:MAG TPA: hypothetical protein DCL49_11595, partial [Candidatus Omnitrophica bacterium]|nr:hypothetical protein [Candidatus Omnitrophota bacterium]